MKKRMTALLAGLMAAAMLCTSAFAAGASPRYIYTTFSSNPTTNSYNDLTFKTYVDAHYTTQNPLAGNATVWVEANATVPGNTMSAQSYVLRSDRKLLVASSFKTDPYSDHFMWSQSDDTGLGSGSAFFFGGYVELNIPGHSETIKPEVNAVRYYNGRCTSVGPENPSGYTLPITRQGLTYGSIMDRDRSGMPDLYAAVGMDGTEGYVASWDFRPASSGTKAMARYNQKLAENNNCIPLYDLEMNQISWFAFSGPAEPDPDTQAKIDELSAQEVPPVENYEAYALNAEKDSPADPNPLNRYIGCVGDNGTEGYMRYLDFRRPQSSTVDVYDADGNVVDQFTFRGTSSCG